MAADWNQPALTTGYAAFLAALLARDVDSATMFQATGSATNIPDKAVRWNATNLQFEQYSAAGGTWGQLWSGGLNVPSVTVASAPTAVGHATRKDYVDAGDAAAKAASLPLVGGTMSGPLTLSQAGTYSPLFTMKAGAYAPFLRSNSTASTLEIVNSANTAVNLSLSEAGYLTIRAGGNFGARPTWAGVTPWDTGNLSNLNQLTNGPGFITAASNISGYSDSALGVRNGGLAGGTRMVFSFSGQGGQPSWLWGSNDGTNMYVWNPAAFSVSYAASAGSVGGVSSPATAGSLVQYQNSVIELGTQLDGRTTSIVDAGAPYVLEGLHVAVSTDINRIWLRIVPLKNQ